MLLVQDVTTTFHCFICLLHHQTPSKVIQQNYRKCSVTTDRSEKNPPAFSPWQFTLMNGTRKLSGSGKTFPPCTRSRGYRMKRFHRGVSQSCQSSCLQSLPADGNGKAVVGGVRNLLKCSFPSPW